MKISTLALLPFGLFFQVYAASQYQWLQDLAKADGSYACSKSAPCEIGCCGPLDQKTGKGTCGFGPDFCGKGCSSSCDRKSECDAGWGEQWSSTSACPLNVCCSKFGFCGTTPEFCGGNKVVSPECDGTSAHKRTIGYYEGWNVEGRLCDKMTPENIPLGIYTHINFAFALINPDTFRIAPMDDKTASRYRSVVALKRRQPALKVWIAIGGWAMNDPGPTQTTFSDLAASEENQHAFFESLVSFVLNNGFDGVDLDWEYPVADDRGGKPKDFENFVTFIKRLRERLNHAPRHIGLSITLPASYWYLRGFDIVHLEPHVDFLNIMTYDIHGVWDGPIEALGQYALAHTNLTEINLALELLWRNHINPERINLGLGFYGRSFTLASPDCVQAGCEWSEGGRPGKCTNTSGILSATEVSRILKEGKGMSFEDKEAAVQIVVFDKDQWVAYDDEKTLKTKLEFANKRCLGGTMVWAVDLDDGGLIGALGQAMGKEKEIVVGDFGFNDYTTDLGTNRTGEPPGA
ncbi:hypothetical protein ASPVEDRAFT_129047 [Aspergillus versicolor CBS 583.65]|uniref:chitinase n=1 Tax=Aspergillus versicolor CBS 583.65 TaxID=1036611 RepID=A0A1L9PGQ9_ASPVE|nr:uncharacterized protein ASPVEDRAFT_129047 [Aspergillus versicolor CBS 583.65]OJJ00682.1 hypothetical protein ASPVEDRAFT_129047 [Aspergillus versicolor CBS 583.65]